MNQVNPLKPQPGDWEAALAAIEAAEVRFDRISRWKRWGGGAGLTATALVAAWFTLFVPANDEALDPASTEVEIISEAVGAENVADASTSSSEDVPTSSSAVEERRTEDAAIAEGEQHENALAYNDRSGAKTDAHSPKEKINLTVAENLPSEQVTASPVGERLAADMKATADPVGFEPRLVDDDLTTAASSESASKDPENEYKVQNLPQLVDQRQAEWKLESADFRCLPLSLLDAKVVAVTLASELQTMVPNAPDQEDASGRGRLFVAYEQSSAIVGWSINPWEDRQFGEWEMAANGSVVWDGRSRSWVALPETDAFGADRAAKGISSNRGVWMAAGLTASRAISPLWEGVLELDAQGLITREMTPTSMLAEEVMVATAPPVWGTLEEESRLRVRWGVGAEWSVNEFNALRITLGGYAGSTPAPSYLDFATGKPVSLGEVRVTWSWE